jgi:hypothetical protein
MSEEGEGGFILRLKTSRYCAESSTLGTSDSVGTTEGFPRNSTVEAYR